MVFEYLEIKGLKQVNLFGGKNNSGKTILLEALRIWAAKGDPTVVNHLIAQRGQFTPGWNESYDSLFHRKKLLGQQNGQELVLTINELSIRRIKSVDFRTYSELYWNSQLAKPNLNAAIPADFPKDETVFVPFGNDAAFPLINLWDKIVLTPFEDDVMRIMRETVLPGLVRLDVNKDRVLVRVEGEEKPLPIQNFGDGARKLLMVAIALVSARDKMLLIDEIESGLHHSVLEVLWDKIFFYSKEWNVQVFATTHSHDVVKTFTYVLEKELNRNDGAYFRLQPDRKTGLIEVISYDLSKLENTLLTNLEPR
jgi:AAA15 family ATPase/GTPase